MPQRKYSKEREKVTKANKRVILPISLEAYNEQAQTSESFRKMVDEMIERYPELFPAGIEAGYWLHDQLPVSKKLTDVQVRRIKLKPVDSQGKAQVFSIVSSDVLPYMTGYTDDVEKALYLRRYGVPFSGLSYVFGRDDNYWFRLISHFGRYEIVSTTVKEPEQLPVDLVADEKHLAFNGEKGYLATTVGGDCVLGVSLALAADEAALTEAYAAFRQEAEQLVPNYTPQTVNTDGWKSTQAAWKALFPAIVLIECFLHAFLRIRDRCQKKWQALWPTLQAKVWDLYQSPDAPTFRQRSGDFLTWAHTALSGPAFEAVEKLVAKTDSFVLAFAHPTAYRTSNMVDRHMVPLDRWLFQARCFHGDWRSAQLQARSWALFHNFLPYSPRAKALQQHAFSSPAHKLNGFIYHEHWLHTLLISTSVSGCPRLHRFRQN
jgi:hypothetical protein